MEKIVKKRKTKETEIDLSIALNGKGESTVATGIPFFDHMLTLFSKHSFIDLDVRAVGDVEVDFHHTVEDVGITLGTAMKELIKDGKGIKRYGFFILPMDEALCEVAIDVSGRPNLIFNVSLPSGKVGDFDTELVESFFKGFVDHSFMTIHINLRYGKNLHHCIEAIFKAFAKALSIALEKEGRYGIPSSKGVL